MAASLFTSPAVGSVAGGQSREPSGDSWQSTLGAIAWRARVAALDAAPRVEELTAPLTSGATGTPDDVEAGTAGARWAFWARQAAGHVRQQAADAAEQAQRGLSQGLEKARSADWGEQAKSLQEGVTRGLDRAADRASSASASLQEKVSQGVERAKSLEWAEHAKELQSGMSRGLEMAATSASSATASFQAKGQAAQQLVSDYSGTGLQTLRDSQLVQKARENVSATAGAARGALSAASSHVSSVAALAMSPVKLAQFAAVFLVGSLFIMLSFNYLPILLIAPQKFSLLFTLGSVTLLSSAAVLSGPCALLRQLAQREKLPFSVMYLLGLVGTLWATLVMRSYCFTALFAVVQACSLVYFIASYLPGGRAALGMFWRLGSRSVRAVTVT